MRSKELKTYNLPENGSPIAVIDAKPYELIAFVLLIGVLMIMTNFSLSYGVTVIGFAIVCFMFLPRTILIDFYGDYLVLYNKANKEDCALIYYEDVVNWSYQKGKSVDYVLIELEDGTVEKIEAFSKSLFVFHLNTFMKNKKK